MSMLSLRWHFTNKPITGAPYNIKSYSLSHSWTLWWRARWLEQCRLRVAAELQQRWRRTNRRWKSVPRSSSSHREGSVTQRALAMSRKKCALHASVSMSYHARISSLITQVCRGYIYAEPLRVYSSSVILQLLLHHAAVSYLPQQPNTTSPSSFFVQI